MDKIEDKDRNSADKTAKVEEIVRKPVLPEVQPIVQQLGMSPMVALNILNSAVASIQLTRQDHQKLVDAVQALMPIVQAEEVKRKGG